MDHVKKGSSDSVGDGCGQGEMQKMGGQGLFGGGRKSWTRSESSYGSNKVLPKPCPTPRCCGGVRKYLWTEKRWGGDGL